MKVWTEVSATAFPRPSEAHEATEGRLCEECRLVLDRLDVIIDALLHGNATLREAADLLAGLRRREGA